MDTSDRSDAKLPAPFPLASSPSLLPRSTYSGDLAIAPGPQIDSRVLVRGLVRYWWRILGLWLIVSVPVAYLIYATVGPTYEAISRIRIEPAPSNLYDASRQQNNGEMSISETYLQTQVNLMKTDQILGRAVADQSISDLPMIKNSEDPNTFLRNKMMVEIEPGTHIINVGLESKDRNEAAAIVNAVVGSYLQWNLRYNETRDANLKASLTEQLASLKDHIDRKKAELQDLHQKGNVQIQKPPLNPSASKNEDEGNGLTISTVDEQQFKTMIAGMVQNDIDLLTAKADLKARLEMEKGQQESVLQAQQDRDNELEERVKEEFLKDSQVAALDGQIKDIQDQMEHLKSVSRKKSDAAVIAAQKQLKKLNKEYEDLWRSKYVELRKALTMAMLGRSVRDDRRAAAQGQDAAGEEGWLCSDV